MPNYNPQDYQIFLDNEYIKKFINQNIKKFFPALKSCQKIEGKHFVLLAATSFLVRYFATFEDKNGQIKNIELRGNRLNSESYKIFNSLWRNHKYKKHFYPRPLYYFTDKQFVLYENYEGEVYRSWPDKSLEFYNETIPLIAEALADLHKSKIKTSKILTPESQEQALAVMLGNIKIHAPNYFPIVKQVASLINQYLKNNSARKLTLCHNDFQSSNIIYNHQVPQIGIIDFELMGKFFPATDVANFNIQLITTIKKSLPLETTIQIQNNFLNEYKKYFNQKWNTELDNDYPYFLAKSMIDIIALYCIQIKSETDSKRQNYLNETMFTYHQKLTKLLKKL